MQSISKILVIRMSSLGDIVMTTGALRALRKKYPSAQIDMLVGSEYKDLLSENPHIDSLLLFPRKSSLAVFVKWIKRLRSEHYDLVYDAHRSLRSMLMMPLIAKQHRAYFDKDYGWRTGLLLFKFNRRQKHSRFLERFTWPLHPFGVTYDKLGPELFIAKSWTDELFTKFPDWKNKNGPRVGIVASAQWIGKRWPADRFLDVMKQLHSRFPTIEWVILGGKNDSFCKIFKNNVGRVLYAQGELSLGQTMSVIQTCDAMIANDTGIMHVADALGVPSILIFGPTSAELGCLPFHPLTEVIQKKMWCRPCSKNGEAVCIRGSRYCLLNIEVGQVIEKAVSLLRKLKCL